MFGCFSEARAELVTPQAATQKRANKTQQLISVTLTYTLTIFRRQTHQNYATQHLLALNLIIRRLYCNHLPTELLRGWCLQEKSATFFQLHPP